MVAKSDLVISLKGIVNRVANVGEQRPNSDAKVFEVAVEIDGTDPSLRPSMTTSNKIIAKTIDSALFIPLECLHSQADTITYVFRKNGMGVEKQEVIIGDTNANDAVVLGGLSDADRVYMSVPPRMENQPIALLEEMNGKRKKDQSDSPLVQKDVPADIVPAAVSGN